jgi:guanyl-specific ribonuclease Sa
MATPRKVALLMAAFLSVTLVASANAQVGGPSVSGGNAIRRADTPATPSARPWQIRDVLSTTRWFAALWLPGRSPIGGSFSSFALQPERRTWLWSRLP